MADESLTKALDVVPIEEEMKRSYLDYAMSVIVSRALPDVRDGLKPVHRRILFAMDQGGYGVGRPHRKSARIVGDVMGKFHPHGDGAIYDAMVRMAQDFSMRLPLIDGQGNFGSLDGDPPAAMRYTEARLAQAAMALLTDIDKDTVDFRPNYDESDDEPTVLPAQFPNLLVNGAGGIAVGMATNIPPHNLGEVIDACIALIDRPEMDTADLIEMIPGPDFPTAGIIMGRAGIQRAYLEGKGGIVVRGRAAVEEIRKDRFAVVITEIPYQVNKSKLVERIAEVVREKKVEGVSDLRDESDRRGVRVVVELKRDADGEVVLNQLYRFTPLQTSFGINVVALSGGRPQTLSLKQVLQEFLAFREEVILRRSAFDLAKARDRAHSQIGLIVAVANIDEVIRVIRASADIAEARAALMARDWPIKDIGPLLALVEEAPTGEGTYRLSEKQAQAILDLRLHRLTALEREKLEADIRELGVRIAELLAVLRSRDELIRVMKDELLQVRAKFATPRRTEIDETGDVDIDIEELIPREDMIVTVTRKGYIKRVKLDTYRAQHRGGKGRSGMATHEDDFVTRLFVASTHTPVLFFSSLGRVYKLKVYRLPEGTPQSRGRAMVNLFPHVAQGETITAVMPLPEDEGSWADLHVMFATASGKVRRNDLSDFTFVPVTGKIAMGLDEGDRLVGVEVCDAGQDILLAAKGGKCVRFPVTAVRVFQSRSSTGVRGMDLASGDEVVSMSVLRHVTIDIEERDAYLRARRRTDEEPGDGQLVDPVREAELAAAEEMILTVTERGFGKRTSAYEYRVTNRGGQGIINIETSARNGAVVATFPVGEDDQIVLTTSGGQLLRTPVSGERGVRITGRNAQGVIIFDVGPDERVVSVARVGDAAEASEAEDGP